MLRKKAISAQRLITKGAHGSLELTPRWGWEALASISGLGIFFLKLGVLTSSVLTQFADKLAAVSDFMNEVISPNLAAFIYEQVRVFITREARAVEDDKANESPWKTPTSTKGADRADHSL